jgi:hypothetical protein
MSMLLEVGDVWVLSLGGRRAALEPIIQIIRSCVIIRCTTVGGISIRSTALGISSKIQVKNELHLHYSLLVHSTILTCFYVVSYPFEIFYKIKLEKFSRAVRRVFLIQNQRKTCIICDINV